MTVLNHAVRANVFYALFLVTNVLFCKFIFIDVTDKLYHFIYWIIVKEILFVYTHYMCIIVREKTFVYKVCLNMKNTYRKRKT